MRHWLFIAALCAALSTPLSGQATPPKVPTGQAASVAWDHDGLNVTHFRIEVAPAATPSMRVRVSADLPAALVNGSQEASTVTLTGVPGPYVVYVVAINKTATGTVETLSDPLPFEVYIPTVPPPPTPPTAPNRANNIRIKGGA